MTEALNQKRVPAVLLVEVKLGKGRADGALKALEAGKADCLFICWNGLSFRNIERIEILQRKAVGDCGLL